MAVVEVDHLVSRREICRILHIPTTTITGWVENQPTFPPPVRKFGMGPIWDIVSVVDWWKNYTPKQGVKVGHLDDDWQQQLTHSEAR